jgi:NitT/TauT family transport system ATP-binding protein
MSRTETPDEKKIIIRGLGKTFKTGKQETVALTNVDLTVPSGEFLCIVGPSGCGKTTLLRILAGLETASCGEVEIVQDSRGLPMNAMVFQENSIFPWFKVWDNVAYGLRMRGISRQEEQSTVSYFLEKVGIFDFKDFYPYQLSGGMKQRVSIARAFANKPEILLMDEPFASLDEQNRLILQEELLNMWEQDRKTVVFITHSIDEAVFLGDRVLTMTARPGRIKAITDIQIPRPRSIEELKGNAHYRDLTKQIWRLVKEEVQRGQ